jgi:ribosomal protein S27E
MPTGNSQNPKRTNDELSLQLRLLKEANAGHLDDLECPKCRHAAVSVWFSHPAAEVYRTWFICGNCDFHTRAQNTERPGFFSDERVSTDLEEKDLAILRQSLFKRPPLRTM